MAKNRDLNKAKENRKDEFYTMLEDIEKEMRHYKEHFKGKVVLCNCDDPYESNFFKYFAINFNFLGLKKLIATCYVTSPVIYTQLSLFDDGTEYGRENVKGKPYKIEITEVVDENCDGSVDLSDVEILLRRNNNVLTILEGDGDFRSAECIELLKESDIVVTNPPFSLFREYIAQLIEYQKDFIILGNMNALHYKEVFPLIRDNKVWLGQSIHSGDREFRVPDDYPLQAAGFRVDENGIKYIRVKGIRWFTNLDYKTRHEDIVLYRTYTPEQYPRYENYDAIEVGSVKDIPADYYEDMGVPDNFIDSYNPDQFEIVGLGCGDLAKEIGITKNYRGRTDLAYIINGKPKCPYSRIVIRRKNSGN
ncbi:MAG: adenine-specific methyltransferase EcoRI family protein [Lachnospiraceae bacterium]|nr:adenine-specific methyltransferase EcoRI family protein [Lachnospiraceae bacterium]